MQIRLDQKRALVTGGNSGIGAAIVRALADAGAKVAINYVTHPEAAEQLVQEIKQNGGDALAVEADISDAVAVENMFKQVDEAWGGIDILVNNAGIEGKYAMSWEKDRSEWEQVLHVNLLGTFYCAQQAVRRMVSQKNGVVLNISSVHEVIAWTGYSAYTASKAAVGMFTKTLAQEAAPHNVRILALGPGAIKTPINKNVWDDQQGMQDLIEKIPLKRIGDPEEIARMATVLVSDTASYITGRTIFVDGGMTDYPSFEHGG